MTARKRPPAVLVDEDPGNVHLRSSSIMGRAGVITLCGWTDVAHSVKRGPAATCGRCLSVLVMCQEMAPPAPLPRAVRELLQMDGEVARLREALERIRAVHASGVGDIGKARRMDDIARAALAAGKREGG